MALEHEELTERIIGAAIEVHRKLGPGFLESVYENALAVELKKRGIKFSKQLKVLIYYDDVEVGEHRLDLMIESLVVVELKAVKALEDAHFSITRSYLRATHKRHGLLLNFAQPTLEIKRVILDG